MKITVDQKELSGALQKLQSITPHRTLLPILENVLLDVTEEGLYCTATNLENTTRILLWSHGEIEETGSITVNCRKLANLVKALDSDEVQLKTTSNDRLVVLSGDGKYTFGGISADEFPDIPTAESEDFTIPAGNLRAALIDTDFAASREEVRYSLNGVALTFSENQIEFAACDSRLFAVVKYHTNIDKEIEQLVIPLKSCQEIKKVFTDDEEIFVSVEGSMLVFFTQTYQFCAKRIDLGEGGYPNYLPIVNFEDKDVVLAHREQLLKAIQRIGLFSKEGSYEISLKVNDTDNRLDVIASNKEGGYDGHESVKISEKTAVLDFKVNSKFLSDVLNHLSCKFVMISMGPCGQRINLKCPDNEDHLYTIALIREKDE